MRVTEHKLAARSETGDLNVSSLRAKRSNPEARKKVWIASSLRSLQ